MKNTGKGRIFDFVLLQLAVMVYSLSTVAGKTASNYPFLSFKYLLFFGLEFMILVVYAVLWQQVIKKFQLSVAYANKAVMLLWTILWYYLIFGQTITPGKAAGVLIVMAGVIVMNMGEVQHD